VRGIEDEEEIWRESRSGLVAFWPTDFPALDGNIRISENYKTLVGLSD